MASDEPWEGGPEEPTFGEGPSVPPKKGMSTTVKVLLIVFGVGGVLALLCCGGIVYLFSRAVKIQTAPADIRATLSEIAAIEIPDDFQPQQGMKVSVGFGMKMALFQGWGGMLMIMELPGGANEEQMRQKMQQNVGQQQNLNVEDSETREFDIKGQTCTFRFAKATDPQGNGFRQVVGMFPGNGGTAMLMLQVPEENYDEEKVVKMIESIH